MENENEKTVWLQGIGKVKAKPAVELRVGDFMLWNYGAISEVFVYGRQTAKYITIRERYPDSWGDWSNAKFGTRRIKKSKLIATISREAVLKNVKGYTPHEFK